MSWIVHARPGGIASGWDYRHGYFPRTVYYKTDAERLRAEVLVKGGTGVRVVKKPKRAGVGGG